MPIKYELVQYRCETIEKVEDITAILQVKGYLTRNQSQSIVGCCKGKTPTLLRLEQRMPKGMTYLMLENGEQYAINNRAKVKYISKIA
jgi:hypothetical protein